MNTFHKLRQKEYWLILGIIIIFFASRLTNLTDLPIFTDEAIYIRWSQIGGRDAAWRFISLTDGKQPLFTWAMMLTLRIFADPLFAGRVVSVATGFFTMIGVVCASWELFKNKKIALFSSLLYLTSPFALMYDRMALMDSMTAMFSVWSFYFAMLLVRHLRLDVALILGLILGGGVLTKTSGFLNIYLLPSTILLFDFKKKDVKNRLLKWAGLLLAAVIFSQLYYSILRLSPFFYMISQKDATFVYPFNEWLTHPFRFLIGNLNGLFDWLTGYLTLPIVLLIFISLLFIFKDWREKLLLFGWFFAPFFALALFGKVLYPRFIFFMSMPLFILAAWGLFYILSKISDKIKQRAVAYFVLFLFIIYPIYVDAKILFSIVTAPIPDSDAGQYINDWPAGWGIREVVDFLEKESKDKKITVYTDGTFGLLPYGLEIYLIDNPNVEIIGVWPIPNKMPDEILAKIEEKPVYLILNRTEKLALFWNTEVLKTYQKGNRKDRQLQLLRLKKPTIDFSHYSEEDILQ